MTRTFGLLGTTVGLLGLAGCGEAGDLEMLDGAAGESVRQTHQAFTYTQLWRDDFNGGQVNEADWNIASSRLEQACNAQGNSFNGEQQAYRKPKGSSPSNENDGPNVANCAAADHNLCVSNGELKVVVREQSAEGCNGQWYNFTSARLNTEGKREFHPWMGNSGIAIEARIRMPLFKAGWTGAPTGIWPAFWTLGHDIKQWPFHGFEDQDWPQSGEIDIAEPGSAWSSGDVTKATLHYSTGNHVDWEWINPQHASATAPDRAINQYTWYTYKVEWLRDASGTPSEIRWYVNDTLSGSVNLYALPNHDFNKPHFLLLNAAMGGAGGGTVNPQGKFPSNGTSYMYEQVMTVDYVAVYALDGIAQTQTAGEYGRPGTVQWHPAHDFNKCVDSYGSGNGTNVYQWDCNANNWQRWNVSLDVGDWNGKDPRVPYTHFNPPYHEVRGVHDGRCMDVYAGNDNGNVVLWDCNGGNNSLFRFVGEGDGRRQLVNKVRGDVLDVAGYDNHTNGASIGVYDWEGMDDQRFYDDVGANAASCTDGRWAIKIYQHCNYGGYMACLPPGKYDMGQLASRGLINDDLSSFKLASGKSVTLYQHAWFDGASTTISGDVSCLTGYAHSDPNAGNPAGTWNDDISSMVVH